MSYHTWSVDGYGICTDDIETTKEKIEKLLGLAPKFNEEVRNYFKGAEINSPELDDYLEYDQDYRSGVAFLLQAVIEEAENVKLGIADDFDGEHYLLLCPAYPWASLTEEEKRIDAKEKADELFKKYIKVLTDTDVNINYQSVENGG